MPSSKKVVFETHIESLTKKNYSIPENLRGKFGGVVHPFMLDFYDEVGIKSMQFMPIMKKEDEPHLQKLGFLNYWGYNPKDWNKPSSRFCQDENNGEREVSDMISTLRNRNVDVILDVVYNHVAGSRANEFRQLPIGASGCSNTLDCSDDKVRAEIFKSLNYWRDMGVSGFRFDLGTILGRSSNNLNFNSNARTMRMIKDEFSDMVLIAEPWDCAGYFLGSMGKNIAEYNDQFRDNVRNVFNFGGCIQDLGHSIFGSQGNFPVNDDSVMMKSKNFISCHDGFTLNDLVSYNQKDNLANGEDNRDGCNDNHSFNHVFDGETYNQTKARRELAKNGMMVALMSSLGSAHLPMADLFGHSQGGNNNAYCQPELGYLDWSSIENGGSKSSHFKNMKDYVRFHQSYLGQFNDLCLEKKLASYWDGDHVILKHDDSDFDKKDDNILIIGKKEGQYSEMWAEYRTPISLGSNHDLVARISSIPENNYFKY